MIATRIMVEIIHEDKHLIAVNKPPGMVVFHENDTAVRKESLSFLLSKRYPELRSLNHPRNGAVHRLDKDTSGIVLFARDEDSFFFLQKEFLKRRAKKKYLALVFKRMKKEEGRIEMLMQRSKKDRRKQAPGGKRGRRSLTLFKVIERFNDFTLLEVIPVTGRKHQIRCHLSFTGHPVVGDRLYRFKDQQDPEDLKRQFLHAGLLKIRTPDGVKTFKAPLSQDLRKILWKLKDQRSN